MRDDVACGAVNQGAYVVEDGTMMLRIEFIEAVGETGQIIVIVVAYLIVWSMQGV